MSVLLMAKPPTPIIPLLTEEEPRTSKGACSSAKQVVIGLISLVVLGFPTAPARSPRDKVAKTGANFICGISIARERSILICWIEIQTHSFWRICIARKRSGRTVVRPIRLYS